MSDQNQKRITGDRMLDKDNENHKLIKYFIYYNEILQRDKKLSGFVVDQYYSNFAISKETDTIVQKMGQLDVPMNFGGWASSLTIGSYDYKNFSKCEKKKNCASNEISKEDVINLFYPSISTPNDRELSEFEIDIYKEESSKHEIINKNFNTCNNNLFEQKIKKINFEIGDTKYVRSSENHHFAAARNNKVESKTPFKTAREELVAQASNNEKSEQNFGYGNIRKTLCARRTPRCEFVPPIKKLKETSNNETKKKENEIVLQDERLLNIDPKMIELIENEMVNSLEKIDWDDIAGLEYAKSQIKEAIIWPMLRPDIFTGIRRPPKGILFFGPPGTGKTLIGKCIASQSKSKFFSISASSLTSKWIGDGEKMVRALFSVAAVNQPSVIFIDEIDSLLCQRSQSDHESSRRLKTEFLVQLDGATTSKEDQVLIIGATNRPQELDEAARRRFVRRLYIPLPDEDARIQILQNLLKTIKHTLSSSDFAFVGKITSNYSGADIASLCQEACMEPLRLIPPNDMLSFDKNMVRPVILNDFQESVKKIRPSVSIKDLNQYLEWDALYGCGRI